MCDPSSMLQFDSWDLCGYQCPLDAICSGSPDQCPSSSTLLPLAGCSDTHCQEGLSSTAADCQECLDELEKLCSDTVCSDACFQLPPGPDSCSLCALASDEHNKGTNACDAAQTQHGSYAQEQQQQRQNQDTAHHQHARLSISSAPAIDGTFPTLHSCHWDGCQASFVNKDDLTRHVTRDHLGCPAWSAPVPSSAAPTAAVSSSTAPPPPPPNQPASTTPSVSLSQPTVLKETLPTLPQSEIPDWAHQLSLLPLFNPSSSSSAAADSLSPSPWPSTAAPSVATQSTPSWHPTTLQTPSSTAASTPDFSLFQPIPSTSNQGSTTTNSYNDALLTESSCDEQPQLHQCQWEDCAQTFDTSAALMAHVSDHLGSGKASYECRWRGCDRAHEGRAFTQRQKAIRHMLTHTGDKPFACKFCAKTFSEATALTQVRCSKEGSPIRAE